MEPEKKSNKTVIIILVLVGVFGLSALVCCAGATFFGISAVGDMEKTYYTECENLENANACERCCSERNHSGHVHGEWINDDGKLCGCL